MSRFQLFHVQVSLDTLLQRSYRDLLLQFAHLGKETIICVRWAVIPSDLVDTIYPHKVFAQARIYNPRVTTQRVIQGQDQSILFGQTSHGCPTPEFV